MHELSICQQIMSQVTEIAMQNQAEAVESITLQVGPLSGVEGMLLKQAFPFAAAQSLAENAELIIEQLPIVIRCQQCGAESEASANKLVCGQCGDYHTELLSGDEMILASVELSRQENTANTFKQEVGHV